MQDYLEFQKGTIPLIISVPHGGILECENIPKRSHGILGIDGKTVEIAKKLMGLIRANFRAQNLKSKFASYVISKVRRSKIDLNRNEAEGFNPSSILTSFCRLNNVVLKLSRYLNTLVSCSERFAGASL